MLGLPEAISSASTATSGPRRGRDCSGVSEGSFRKRVVNVSRERLSHALDWMKAQQTVVVESRVHHASHGRMADARDSVAPHKPHQLGGHWRSGGFVNPAQDGPGWLNLLLIRCCPGETGETGECDSWLHRVGVVSGQQASQRPSLRMVP